MTQNWYDFGLSGAVSPRGYWFHCASWDDALAIEDEGFISPAGEGFWQEMNYDIRDMFSPEERAFMQASGTEEEMFIRGWEIYKRKLFGGTFIWLTKEAPYETGDVCFRVRLPRGAKVVEATTAEGYLGWVPLKKIPPSYFRRLSPEDIEYYEEREDA